MNHELYHELLEASWRRKLTGEEEAELRAYLAAHPELQEDWEDEVFLNQQLERLSNAPVSSNFTAQVLQKLDIDLAREERELPIKRAASGWLRSWLPRYASITLLVLLAAIAGVQYQEYRRTQLVENALKVAPLAAVPAPDIYRDFDAIHQLRYVPTSSDEDLLAALQLK